MDVREKLVGLANDVLRYLPWGEIQKDTAERIADRMMDHGVTVQEWISVKDRLPEYHKKVLTRSKMGTSGHSFYVCELCMFDNELGWMFNDGFEAQDLIEITHWMPLPEPPKGE